VAGVGWPAAKCADALFLRVVVAPLSNTTPKFFWFFLKKNTYGDEIIKREREREKKRKLIFFEHRPLYRSGKMMSSHASAYMIAASRNCRQV